MVPPMAMPHAAVPIHRGTYVVSAGPAYHHPIVPSLRPTYGHMTHPTLLPTHHPTIPFPNRDPGLGLMNEEEFYRAKKKLQE